jgi:hypothetical protein
VPGLQRPQGTTLVLVPVPVRAPVWRDCFELALTPGDEAKNCPRSTDGGGGGGGGGSGGGARGGAEGAHGGEL